MEQAADDVDECTARPGTIATPASLPMLVMRPNPHFCTTPSSDTEDWRHTGIDREGVIRVGHAGRFPTTAIRPHANAVHPLNAVYIGLMLGA